MTSAGIQLVGGLVFDSDAETIAPATVRIEGGLIAQGTHPDDRIVDVSGSIVSPGLVDLHTHIFRGQDLGLTPDALAAASGTTTFIDAGSAGGHLFDAFRLSTIDRSDARIRAFVNIASIGTTSILLGGELMAQYYSDEDVAVECIEANRDVVVGVKVRASGNVGGDNTPEALRRARRVADRVGLPLMVHLGPAPCTVDEIVEVLGAGDILTHAFTGWEGNTVLDGDRLRDSVTAARGRGVVVDIGHGQSGFSSVVARRCVELGQLPDTISSDLHTYSEPVVVDLPTVLGKMIALGMTLEQVLVRATRAPAAVVGLDSLGVGTLRVGAPADVAVMRLEEGPVQFGDGFGATFSGEVRLVPVLTVMGGRVIAEPTKGMPA